MDSHPSCRRPHKFPAYTFKEPGSWPQRLPPCPDVSVEVSRSFWQLASVSSTPRDGCLFEPPRRSRPKSFPPSEPHILAAPPGSVNTSFRGLSVSPHPAAEAFVVSEPPSIGPFHETATSFFKASCRSAPPTTSLAGRALCTPETGLGST